MHVVEESISVLNVSRMEIKENRQRLNDLLLLIGSVEDKFINISDQLEKEIREVHTALILFSRHINRGTKTCLIRVRVFLRTFSNADSGSCNAETVTNDNSCRAFTQYVS